MKKRRRSNLTWDQHTEPPDPELFRERILPLLAHIPLKTLVEAVGLSKSYCSLSDTDSCV
jgi:hypothetical protein